MTFDWTGCSKKLDSRTGDDDEMTMIVEESRRKTAHHHKQEEKQAHCVRSTWKGAHSQCWQSNETTLASLKPA